jgi:hypothetical protein
MQITSKTLLEIIPYQEIANHHITVGAAVTVVRRHFCTQMNTNNLCTQECSKCALHILNSIDGIERAGKPVGMFVGRIRQEVATVIESANTKKEPSEKPIKLGRTQKGDAFEELLAGIT